MDLNQLNELLTKGEIASALVIIAATLILIHFSLSKNRQSRNHKLSKKKLSSG